MEPLSELVKGPKHNSLPDSTHRVKVKDEVMDGVQGRPQHLADDREMAQVRP